MINISKIPFGIWQLNLTSLCWLDLFPCCQDLHPPPPLNPKQQPHNSSLPPSPPHTSKPSLSSNASSAQLPCSHTINTGGQHPTLCPGRTPLKIGNKCWTMDWPEDVGLTGLNLPRVFVTIVRRGSGWYPLKRGRELLHLQAIAPRWLFWDHKLSLQVQDPRPRIKHTFPSGIRHTLNCHTGETLRKERMCKQTYRLIGQHAWPLFWMHFQGISILTLLATFCALK